MDLDGTATGVSGRCPAITFVLLVSTVATDQSTSYKGGNCGDVKSGQSVEVAGRLQLDGTISADRITVKKGKHD